MRVDGKVIKWTRLGRGGFNLTSVSDEPFTFYIDGIRYHQRWILKVPIAHRHDELNQKMNHSTRAVRLWNTLNPTHPAIELPTQGGWIAPYLGRNAAIDDDIALKQIELYRKHRRIIADACGYQNFLSFEGEIICVDVDVATHQNSPLSQRIHCELIQMGKKNSCYESYWSDYQTMYDMPKSVQMTKTLLYLDKQMANEHIPNHYLTPLMLEQLHPYQRSRKHITHEVLHTLHQHSLSPERKSPLSTFFTSKNNDETLLDAQTFSLTCTLS